MNTTELRDCGGVRGSSSDLERDCSEFGTSWLCELPQGLGRGFCETGTRISPDVQVADFAWLSRRNGAYGGTFLDGREVVGQS